MDTPAASLDRFHRRGASETEDPWHDQVRAVVAANGGDEALRRYHAALERLLAARPAGPPPPRPPRGGRDREHRRRCGRDLPRAARLSPLTHEPTASAPGR